MMTTMRCCVVEKKGEELEAPVPRSSSRQRWLRRASAAELLLEDEGTLSPTTSKPKQRASSSAPLG
jgi:hypothetical protein